MEKQARRSPMVLRPHIPLPPRAIRYGGRSLLTDRTALHQRQGADPHELVNQAIPGDERAVAHAHVPGHQRAARKDDRIAEDDIVGDVAVLHEIVVRADNGRRALVVRAVHGHVLAEHVPIPDPQLGGLARVFQVLWGLADDAAREKPVVRANAAQSGRVHVGTNVALGAQFDPFINDGIRPDPDRAVQLRLGMHNGSGVNHPAKVRHPGKLPSEKEPRSPS